MAAAKRIAGTPHFIFMRGAKDGKERTRERMTGREKKEWEDWAGRTHPTTIHASKSLQLPLESEPMGVGWRGVNRWTSRSVKSYRILCTFRKWEDVSEGELAALVTVGYWVPNCAKQYIPSKKKAAFMFWKWRLYSEGFVRVLTFLWI